jgi:hypothetical protein
LFKFDCELGDLGTYNSNLTSTSTDYYALIIHTPNNINILGTYEKVSVYVTAGNQIIFKPGFQAKAGSILNASIQPCATVNSLALKIDSAKNNKLIEAIIEPQMIQEQKTIKLVSQVSIYPNPNEGKFSIDMRNLNETVIRIEIYNSAGTIQKVINKGIKIIEDIDMSKAPSDTYFIKIISDKSIYNYKVVRL